ncbi:hypothetical protein Tco_0887958, partial [Tanacetum coccineum]
MVDGPDVEMTDGVAYSKSGGVFVHGTYHVLVDVAEVTVVGSWHVSSGLTNVVVALFAGENVDGSLPSSVADEDAIVNPSRVLIEHGMILYNNLVGVMNLRLKANQAHDQNSEMVLLDKLLPQLMLMMSCFPLLLINIMSTIVTMMIWRDDTDDFEEMDIQMAVAMLDYERVAWAPRSQGNRNRDAPRRNAPAKKDITSFALMAYTSQGSSSSSSSNSE